MRPRRPAQLTSALVGLCVALSAAEAEATYSILGVDLDRGAVGAAVASCVPLEVLLRVYGGVPGRGALVTQSFLHPTAHDLGLSLLEDGRTPDEVLAALVDPSFDPDFQKRQYAVIDLSGSLATSTGASALPWAGGAVASPEGLVLSAQGNILTGPEVVELAAEAGSEACDLPARLLEALEAPAAAGLGDSRCTPHGLPARSAVLFVDLPEEPAGSYLALTTESPDPTLGPSDDPVAALRGAFDLWRETHPCALPPAARREVEPPGATCSLAPSARHPGAWAWLGGALGLLGAARRGARLASRPASRPAWRPRGARAPLAA